ncbi:MAG: cadmium-translocating P-type ATPase [Staphylococcus equorum]|uniref:heavy metal translocating P-type ATPase n=1 Tax=Staphylococcus TaxID=1279 RepID=UPI0008535988|nr:heavy metal translocating P-type ATPase [Staphylococcus equorum]MDG0822819.1 cadmium-translocating P-type ATPase [Staphylococcus equorum]MDG0836681.1 cadmium-translocating P-type ATPase [Staphylococcus equorum]MDK9871273.1 heavy metal translocating P-type ATPase [Staphylococcus equorum]MDK9877682.1 heavy metal translocating P-type ATPase [Staphylococcus equorum]MDN5828466.1 cadmium-translocating P-type ATPase [Staphylococcus equorum]
MSEQQDKVTNKERSTYRVQGFSCANCAGKFETNVKKLPNVHDASVNFGASQISVQGEASIEELEKAGAFENLKVIPKTTTRTTSNSKDEQEEKIPFYKKHSTLIYSALFMTLGFISMFINGNENIVTALLFITSMIVGGASMITTGLKNLIQLEFDMRTLMTIAVIGGVLIGEWAEVSVVVILFSISESLERFSMDRARASITSLMDVAPNKALIKRNNQEMTVHVDDIVVGDIMIVKPGQKIAMDGIIIDGYSSINQSAITGESVPVEKYKDDDVFAGTLNEEGFLEVKITKRVEDTTISKIIHLVEEAQAERAPSQAFVDKFAKYYTPVIIAIAAMVTVLPPLFFEASWDKWVYQGLAVLVVGCPCALVISTPIAIVSAIGNAAKKGVLVKGGIYLEEIGALKAIAFDKTGTLTKGVPVVTDFKVINNRVNEREILSIIAALEYRSQHPLASAIMSKANVEHISYSDIIVEDFSSITGKGIKGSIDGRMTYVGNSKMFSELLTANNENKVRNLISSLQEQGKTVMLVGTDQGVEAVIAVADEVRETSQQALHKLHQANVENTVMLTGDNQNTAGAIGNQVGVTDIKAELLPEDKLKVIKQLKSKYKRVAMVGDGVNDAPALAASTVGVAMGGAGTDAALETADVVLMGDDLNKLPFTIKLSRKTLNIIKANITFAIIIKIIALLLVIPGWLTLWIAILSDMGATLLVALNGMRLMRVKENE